MCLSIPGKVVEIKGDNALIDYNFEKRKAKLLFPINPNDYVIVNAGFVIDTIPKNQAEKFLEAIKNA